MSSTKNEAHIKPSHWFIVNFEFDDNSVLEFQEVNGDRLMVGLMREPRPETNSSLYLSHRHEEERMIGRIGIAFFGNPPSLNPNAVIERATINILGWLRDGGICDVSFIYASLRSGILGLDRPDGGELLDITNTAHSLGAELKLVDEVIPKQFID